MAGEGQSSQQGNNPSKPNFLQEADGSWSSKRLQSFISFGIATLIATFQIWHNAVIPYDPVSKVLLGSTVDLSVVIGTFLGYAAACQGMTLVKST